MDCIICRYGELALKGKNREDFENKLVSNIKACLKAQGIEAPVKKTFGRIFVYTKDKNAVSALQYVFGLVSVSPALISPLDLQKIKEAALSSLSSLGDKPYSFRVSSRRQNKAFALKSQELDMAVGEYIIDNKGWKVSLKKFDVEVGIEIGKVAYIYTERFKCPGGLPLGMGGEVACLVRNRRDILAAWLFMKRGCNLHIFGSADIGLLEKFSYGVDLTKEPLPGKEPLKSRSARYKALVVGDSLDDLDDYGVLTLSPIISYSEEQVEKILGGIDEKRYDCSWMQAAQEQ